MRRLIQGIADGYDEIEGVGSTAGQGRGRIAEWDVDSVYVVERCFVLVRSRGSVKGRGSEVACCCHFDQSSLDQ